MKQEGMTRKKKVALVLSLALAAIAVALAISLLSYYHTVDAPELQSNDKVRIVETSDYTLFDGPGTETALIFYPGAKVDEQAYAAMLYQLSEGGLDCFLVRMPFHLAIFGANRAEAIVKEYGENVTKSGQAYQTFLLGGHSLGGVMASSYAYKHADIRGVVFLASYPSKDLNRDSNKIALSIYGSNDKVLNRNSYEKAADKFPDERTTEVVIEGGNHSGFGYYGPQKGDGEATISKEEQIRQTTDAILAWAGITGSNRE